MRNLQSNISTIGNTIVRQGSQLIVRSEVLRSLCADSIAALASYASRLSIEMSGASGHWPNVVRGFMKPRVRTARCFATVNQRQRRHDHLCPRAVA